MEHVETLNPHRFSITSGGKPPVHVRFSLEARGHLPWEFTEGIDHFPSAVYNAVHNDLGTAVRVHLTTRKTRRSKKHTVEMRVTARNERRGRYSLLIKAEFPSGISQLTGLELIEEHVAPAACVFLNTKLYAIEIAQIDARLDEGSSDEELEDLLAMRHSLVHAGEPLPSDITCDAGSFERRALAPDVDTSENVLMDEAGALLLAIA